MYCCHRDKTKDDKGKEKKKRVVTQKDQKRDDDDDDDDGGQWEKVVGGKGLNQEALFQDKVKQLFPKDIEINEKNLSKKRKELLEGHCKTVSNCYLFIMLGIHSNMLLAC